MFVIYKIDTLTRPKNSHTRRTAFGASITKKFKLHIYFHSVVYNNFRGVGQVAL